MQGEGIQCCRGVGEASIRRAGPWPPCKRLASAIRARHGRHGELTLYRDVAGAETVSSMATGSEEDIILFVFGMIDMYTTKCNKKPKEFMQIVHQVKVD